MIRLLRAVWHWLVDDRPYQREPWHSTWQTDDYDVLLEDQGGESR